MPAESPALLRLSFSSARARRRRARLARPLRDHRRQQHQQQQQLSSSTRTPLLPSADYGLQRRAEAWQYGAGLDYVAAPSAPVPPDELARAKAAAKTVRERAAAVGSQRPSAVSVA